MMTALLAVMLSLQEERIQTTMYFIHASLEDRGAIDPALKEIEADLKELPAFNRFELVGGSLLRYSPVSHIVVMSAAVKEGRRLKVSFTPQPSLNGKIRLDGIRLAEERTEDRTTINQGVALRSLSIVYEEILNTTVEVAEGRLSVIGTIVVEGKNGPMTLVVAVRTAGR